MDIQTIDRQRAWTDLALRIENFVRVSGQEPVDLLRDLKAAFHWVPPSKIAVCFSNYEYAMTLVHTELRGWRESISNVSQFADGESYTFQAEIIPSAHLDGCRRVTALAETPARALLAALCRAFAHAKISDRTA
jgi:hypothetical protein